MLKMPREEGTILARLITPGARENTPKKFSMSVDTEKTQGLRSDLVYVLKSTRI